MTKYLLSILAIGFFSLAQVQAQEQQAWEQAEEPASTSFSLLHSSTTLQGTEDVYLSLAVSSPIPVSAITAYFTLPPYITVKEGSEIWSRVGSNNEYVFSETTNDPNKYAILLYQKPGSPETPISGKSGDELLRIPLTIHWADAPQGDVEHIIEMTECIVGSADTEIDLSNASISLSIPSSVTGISAGATGEAQVYLRNQNLYIDSPVAERVTVYSIAGALLGSLDKQAGIASIASTTDSTGVLVVKGSSGWVRKLVVGN